MKPNLKEFIVIANEQNTGKGTSDSATLYTRENKGLLDGLNIDISFGIGRASAIPWIAFTGFKQTVKNGIYPVYHYYKDFNVLILAFGVSETNVPEFNWRDFESKQTIKEYFDEYFSKKPRRYGNSFVFKVYDANSLPSKDILKSDLHEIIEIYKNQFSKKRKRNQKIIQLDFDAFLFKVELVNSNLSYSSYLISRFTASLLTKPFLILTGLSGSGKTKLAQSFVQWICQEERQYRIIPVGADWTNREPLLGYPNSLNSDEYVKPDSGALDLLIEANENPDQPYFLILDEMNLSHVERYFADFLSAMESKEPIPLHVSEEPINGVPGKLKLPGNLFVIGTVNIDETTHMFSPKVLDRANTIEFRISKEQMRGFLSEIREIDMDAIVGKGASMAQSFLQLSQDKSLDIEHKEEISETLLQFFDELGKTGAEFGYRSATEMLRLIRNLGTLDKELSTDEKLDIAIIQKLLPKLHGSRRKLVDRLKVLGKFCLNPTIVEKKEFDIENDILNKEGYEFFNDDVRYPLSLEKISRMYRGSIDNGFASFAEA